MLAVEIIGKGPDSNSMEARTRFFQCKIKLESAVHYSISQGNDTCAVDSQGDAITSRSSQHVSPASAPSEAEHVSGINSSSPPLLAGPLQEEGEQSLQDH